MDKTISFTGHRQIASDRIHSVKTRLDGLITDFAKEGYARYLVGGAIGFDTLAAQAVLRVRGQNSIIKLIIVQPCQNQDAKWLEADKAEYKRILAAADEVICLSDHYYNGCMQARNRYLVDNSSVCIAYMNNPRSGTGQTVRFAREQGLRVINLAE